MGTKYKFKVTISFLSLNLIKTSSQSDLWTYDDKHVIILSGPGPPGTDADADAVQSIGNGAISIVLLVVMWPVVSKMPIYDGFLDVYVFCTLNVLYIDRAVYLDNSIGADSASKNNWMNQPRVLRGCRA
jgi:hypothetical protein